MSKGLVGLLGVVLVGGVAGFTLWRSSSGPREASLLGSWVQPLPDSDCKNTNADEVCFENDSSSMTFDVVEGKNIYNAYIHNRPDLADCIWSLTDRKVLINCSTIEDTFTIKSLTANELIIARGGVSETYSRVKDTH